MKRRRLALTFVLVSLIPSLPIGWRGQSATAGKIETIRELPAKTIKDPERVGNSPKSQPRSNQPLPRISFEKTVCDLGEVGQGTKNSCEFRFTNTGRGPLKIGKISRTCGCTVFQLDKKEYAPAETGAINVIKGVRLPHTYSG